MWRLKLRKSSRKWGPSLSRCFVDGSRCLAISTRQAGFCRDRWISCEGRLPFQGADGTYVLWDLLTYFADAGRGGCGIVLPLAVPVSPNLPIFRIFRIGGREGDRHFVSDETTLRRKVSMKAADGFCCNEVFQRTTAATGSSAEVAWRGGTGEGPPPGGGGTPDGATSGSAAGTDEGATNG